MNRHRSKWRRGLLAATTFTAVLLTILTLVGLDAEAFAPTNGLAFVAFGSTSHSKMTEQAITEIDEELFGITRLTKSMKKAIEQIAEANAAVDEDQFSSRKHFDGENFAGGQSFILINRRLLVSTIKNDSASDARYYLGQALHSIQDFYSHSNWIELGGGGPNGELGVVGATIGNTAPMSLGTCVPCISTFPGLCPDCSANAITGRLTSGYYGGEDRLKPSALKCSHGGIFDSSATGLFGEGINKDVQACDFSPHNGLHGAAVGVAREATKKFIRELQGDLTESEMKLLLGVGPSLGFAIDTTGSMGSIISGVKSIAISIVNGRLGTPEEPSKYVLVPFNDPGVGPTTATNDANQFKAGINSLFASGGGDCPELSMTGMLRAVAASDERGTVFMFTDASSKDASLAGAVASLAADKRVKVFPMTFGSCSPIDPGYFLIAEQSGGQLFELFRSEAGAVTQLADFLVRSDTVDIASVSKPLAGTSVETVPVDSDLAAVSFSISGTPTVSLRRPDGSVVAGGDAGAQVVPLSKGKLYRIATPPPGTWTVELSGVGSYSLLVAAEAELDLEAVRFVELRGRPGHEGLFPIAGLPTEGELNTVVAVMSGSFGEPSFELRTRSGSVLQPLELTQRPGDDVNEFSGDVTLPSQSFLVYATGVDPAGFPYQRLVASAVEPQSVKISKPAPKELVIDQTTSFVFTVTNTGAADDFRFTASDSQAYVRTVVPSSFHLESGASIEVTVSLRVPATALEGTPDTLTVNVENLARTTNNFAVLNSVVIEVVADTTPPEIVSLTATPNLLWPPNHRLREISLDLEVQDDQDPSPVCEIGGVTSNEPIDGPGDGSTDPDWLVPDPSILEMQLRAERSGTGSNRIYTVTVECTDEAGNTAAATVDVTVPHNR